MTALARTRGISDRLIGWAIGVYRRTPLYPAWGARLARLLALVRPRGARELFVHDAGDVRMWIDLDEVIDSQIYYAGAFEPETIATVRKLVPEAGVAVDVGANVGWVTMHLARSVGPSGRVISFEPTPWALDRLKKNVELNAMTQVRIEPLALGSRTQCAVGARITSSYRTDGTGVADEITFDVIRLDDYLGRNPVTRLDFLKIDTDGMEEQVLRGAEQSLARFRPAIAFELAPTHLRRMGSSYGAVLSFLRGLGYRFLRQGSLAEFDDVSAEAERLPANRSMDVVAVAVPRQ